MRAVISFLATLVIVIVIAWLGLWWYAQGRLQNGFQTWAEQQATHGVTVAYTSLSRGTSPTTALINITNLSITFPATADGAQPVLSLPTLGLEIDAATPTIFHLNLPTKITINGGGNMDIGINAGSIAASEKLDPNAFFNKSVYPFRGGDFSATQVDFLASSGSLLVLHINSLTGHADLNLAAPAGAAALTENISLTGVSLSPLMTKIASIPFNGQINQLTLTLNLTGPVPPQIFTLATQIQATAHDPIAQQKLIMPIVHQWAAAGGAGNMGVSVAIGPSTASAAASIKFDANVQPSGTADIAADHMDEFTTQITAAYPQISDTIAGAEAQLTPYITTNPQTGQTLAIHATYGAGAVNINGAKVAPLPPINWTTLENPPPAPPPSGQ